MEDIIQQSEDNIQAIKKSPIRSPLKIPKGRYGKRKIRCKKCEGCTSEDCGVCNYCLYVNFGHPLPLFMGRWAPGFLYRTALGLLRTINLFPSIQYASIVTTVKAHSLCLISVQLSQPVPRLVNNFHLLSMYYYNVFTSYLLILQRQNAVLQDIYIWKNDFKSIINT